MIYPPPPKKSKKKPIQFHWCPCFRNINCSFLYHLISHYSFILYIYTLCTFNLLPILFIICSWINKVPILKSKVFIIIIINFFFFFGGEKGEEEMVYIKCCFKRYLGEELPYPGIHAIIQRTNIIGIHKSTPPPHEKSLAMRLPAINCSNFCPLRAPKVLKQIKVHKQ